VPDIVLVPGTRGWQLVWRAKSGPIRSRRGALIRQGRTSSHLMPFHLTSVEQKENIHSCPLQVWSLAMSLDVNPAKNATMSAPASCFDNRRYEQACDQAIAMCDGNLRSTIKALIMANEYLEAELLELQAAVAAGCAPSHATSDAA
jgi:hypothetical protein